MKFIYKSRVSSEVLLLLFLVFSLSSCQYFEKNSTKFTPFKIDKVADIRSKDVRSEKFITKRLELLVGKSMKRRCESLGVKYPPQYVLHRAFKYEEEYEIWVGNSGSDSLKLLATLPICAVDNEPSPKLEQGDRKTPEGFYKCQILYGSNLKYMWVNLNNDQIDSPGRVGGSCSSFKICLDYPLSIDKQRTKDILKKGANPGGEICIHANCASAGCISFKNSDYLPVFLSQKHHNSTKYGRVMIHIFPFRFNSKTIESMLPLASKRMKRKEVKEFWEQIKKGYTLFEKTHKPIKVTYKKGKYNFK